MSLSKRLFLLMCFCIFPYIVYGQRVGLVLSGGGAKGIAHIGLIKALEEKNDGLFDYDENGEKVTYSK